MLPTDIKNRINQEFKIGEIETVEELLSQYNGNEPERVVRCIIHLSSGSCQELKHNCEIANTDYRDIILFAEYDKENRKINDFTKPFNE